MKGPFTSTDKTVPARLAVEPFFVSRPATGSPIKSPEVYSDDQLRLTAHLYYRDSLGQADLARFLHGSQSKISRMLAVARERGIVRLSVEAYEAREPRLEKQLSRRFGLNSVAVVRVPAGSTPQETRRFVAHFGSPLVASLVSPRANVVVAGAARSPSWCGACRKITNGA
jgi:deoxyribonucleoside regulator